MAPIRTVVPAILLSLGLASALAEASTTLKLKKSFINQNKDRTTLTASFVVDKAHDHPKVEQFSNNQNGAILSDTANIVTVDNAKVAPRPLPYDVMKATK